VLSRTKSPAAPARYLRVAASVSFALVMIAGCRERTVGSYAPHAASTANQATGVGCTGRILPEGGTFFVFPYAAGAGGAAPVVASVYIKSGDEVAAGQPIASLSSRPFLEGAVKAAQAQVTLANARLARAKAAASPDEAASAKENVARLQLQRDDAARAYERNKPLYAHDFLSKAQLETLETNLRESDALLAQAREQLHGIVVVRPEDIAIAESEVRVSEADLLRAQQDAASTIVRSPSKARALRVIAHAGEQVGPEGIAEFADTAKMEVVAEVYEADIVRVHAGQKATITAEILPKPLHGTVVWIGSQVEKQEALAEERGVPSDARIFKVRIKVSDPSILADRINGIVNVVIEP
jgi:HlyD family secretion protein